MQNSSVPHTSTDAAAASKRTRTFVIGGVIAAVVIGGLIYWINWIVMKDKQKKLRACKQDSDCAKFNVDTFFGSQCVNGQCN